MNRQDPEDVTTLFRSEQTNHQLPAAHHLSALPAPSQIPSELEGIEPEGSVGEGSRIMVRPAAAGHYATGVRSRITPEFRSRRFGIWNRDHESQSLLVDNLTNAKVDSQRFSGPCTTQGRI